MEEKSKAIPTELGKEKIGKLLKQYALPAIIAQTASSLYNMVDSIFIGQGKRLPEQCSWCRRHAPC